MSFKDDLVYRSRVRGCLLGGAVGDALGSPVEFWDFKQILEVFGEKGVTRYLPMPGSGSKAFGQVSDDTQMTLFTVEGLIRASVRTDRGIGFTVAVLHAAYGRWLDTQILDKPSSHSDGWLKEQEWLYAQRAPGSTCLESLISARENHQMPPFGTPAENNSKVVVVL